MRGADLPAVLAIAAACHPNYPERPEVFAERMALSPEGCWLLEAGDKAFGYGVMHPAARFSPPALDTLLGELPGGKSVWYLHDVALLPQARGDGAASRLVAIACRAARRAGLDRLALVAVNGSAPFWARRGFSRASHPGLAEKLASYGDDAIYLEKPV
jgi:GNAT superfamily N-acetyltransferase